MEIAVACCVTTPDLSPVKTRLATGLGSERAELFYRKCLDLVGEAMHQAAKQVQPTHSLHPYWAVAEEAGQSSPLWARFPRVFQGSGDWGTRQKTVYEDLKGRHSGVLLISADYPLLSPQILAYAAQLVAESDEHILGPSDLGDYYLFGSRHLVDVPDGASIWNEVPYGSDWAAEVFAKLLESRGEKRKVLKLEPLYSIDTAQDLERLNLEIAQPFDPWAAKVRRALEQVH